MLENTHTQKEKQPKNHHTFFRSHLLYPECNTNKSEYLLAILLEHFSSSYTKLLLFFIPVADQLTSWLSYQLSKHEGYERKEGREFKQ